MFESVNKMQIISASKQASKQSVVQFKQAPLPFVGQKRMFLKHFETILNENIKDDGEGWTIIDTFGASG